MIEIIITILVILVIMTLFYTKYKAVYSPQSIFGFLLAIPTLFLWYAAKYDKYVIILGLILLTICGLSMLVSVNKVTTAESTSDAASGIGGAIGAFLNAIGLFVSIVLIVGGGVGWAVSRGLLVLFAPETTKRLNAGVRNR